MADNKRFDKFCEMIDELDAAYELIHEYDSQLHNYNGVVLYQAESQLIKLIGNRPGIPAHECAEIQKKTLSACSQLVKKLKAKGWIRQERNVDNNRIYNLYLTDEGNVIYDKHRAFEEKCYMRTFRLLDSMSEKDFETYLSIQRLINEGFRQDIEDGKEMALESE